MPDANKSTTVDGVEPTILVKFAGNGNNDGTDTIKLFPDDDGAERFIVCGGDAVYLTENEVSLVARIGIIEYPDEIPEHEDDAVDVNGDSFPAPEGQRASQPQKPDFSNVVSPTTPAL